MAKYRITSLPQSLPKAQKGLFNKKLDIKTPKNKFKNLFDRGVLDNKGHINLFGKNKKENSNQEDFPEVNWSGTTPELMQPGQESFELKPTYAPTPEFTQADVNLSSTLSKIQEERNRLAQEKENRDWEEMMKKRNEQFKTSKKYDKIEPLLTIDSEGYADEDLVSFQEAGYFPVKDSKTNKINLYPANEINSRIIDNGLRTDEIVKKLGIGDAESVKAAFGDLMTAADQQYSATVQNKLLQKSLDEGISLEDAVKKLSGKLGTEKGLQKYVAPTTDLINNYIDEIKKNVNQPAEKEIQSMYYDNRNPNQGYSPKIDYNSYDPGLKYNMDYYNTTNNWGQFLKDYSDYNKEYNKEYADSFYNKQNQTADRLNLPVSDRTGNLKNQQDVTNQNISLTKQVGDASAEAGNKTVNKKYIEQLQADMARVSDPLVKYELGKKLDAVKNNPEAFSKLLKGFESGEVFTKEDEDNINALTFSILQKESNPDTIKAGVDRPKLTTSDKVFDVLTNPFDAFKYSNQGGLDNMWTSGMGYNERKLLERANPELNLGTQDNLVGNALNTWNPMRFARDVDSDLDREDYASAGLEALEFATPAMFSKAARAGRLARDASKFFPTGSITPGLKGFTGSAFESLNPYFAYEAIRPGGELNRSYDLLKEGNIKEGLQEGAFGLLNLLPAAGTFKSLKGAENIGGAKPFVSQQLSFKKGGELPTYQGPFRSIVKSIPSKLGNLAMKTAVKTLQLPGVKPFFRSNYNPISYPIKLLGEKIARQSLNANRNKQQVIAALTKKAAPEEKLYFGNVTAVDPEYGYGKRDLIANYFRGEDAGFKPIDYDIYSDPGLKKYIDKYGPLKTYELNSSVKHGQPLDIADFTRVLNINDTKLSNFDQDLYEDEVFQNMPGLENYYYNEYMNNLPGTSTPSPYEAQRQYYKKMLHQYFDERGIETLPLDVSPGYNANVKNYLNYNPVISYDDIAGHMGYLKRLPNKEDFEFTTRDIWKFTPDEYNSKWEGTSNKDQLFKQLQVEAMEAFGKPVVLTQTNPIKFKNGGSMELELTPKQIKEYIKAGYIIEDI